MSDKAIYKLNFDCGRMGTLEGIFVANKSDVKNLIDSKEQVYFGEVLGKNSEIGGSISKKELIMLTDAPEAVIVFEKYHLSNGYNPFDYIERPDNE